MGSGWDGLVRGRENGGRVGERMDFAFERRVKGMRERHRRFAPGSYETTKSKKEMRKKRERKPFEYRCSRRV